MKRFHKNRPAPVQLEVMRVLDESPLPWNSEMVAAWIGWTPLSAAALLPRMSNMHRIQRVESGLYTSLAVRLPAPRVRKPRYLSPKVVVTAEMVERYIAGELA